MEGNILFESSTVLRYSNYPEFLDLIVQMHLMKSAHSQNQDSLMLQTVPFNLSDAIKVGNVSQKLRFVMAKINVLTEKMRWDVISRDREDVQKTHSHVEVVNVFQNMSSVMQSYPAEMALMNHHTFVDLNL